MASQVSPGVVLRERDLSNAVIVGNSALTAAFSSSFQKGPIGVITSISDQKSFISTFGTPNDSNAEDWFCLLYTSPSPRDQRGSRMPSSA